MATRARGRRRTRRYVLLGIFAVLVVWGAFVALALVRARHDTHLGITTLESAQQQLTPGQLLRGEGVSELKQAQADFTRARTRVRSPFLAPLRVVPLLGRQIDSVDTLTGSAARVVAIGIDAVDQSRAVVNSGNPKGEARVQLVDRLATIADHASQQLQVVDLGPSHLVGPLADARSQFATRLGDLRHAISQLRNASHGFADFLKGPSRYLVLAANNAEMRVGSGTFLSIGVLTVDNGTLNLVSMSSVGDFTVPAGAVPLTGDFAGRWGFLHPNVEWRNLGASPQFPSQARLATQMWHAATGQTVNGVLALDVVALKALLQATGPVHLADGSTVTADDVLSDVMLKQYIGLTGYSDQTARRDRLSSIARGALSNFETGGWHAADLVDDLRGAAQGRHLLAWSPTRTEQAGWTASGIDGVVPTDGVLVGLHNRGGNKLDQFLNVHGSVAVARPAHPTPGAGWNLTVALDLLNVTPATGIPQYVEGPYPGAVGAAAGLYQGYAVFELPRFAGSIHLTVGGKPAPFVTAGPDGTSQVVAAYFQVPRGISLRVVATFSVPAAERSLEFAPSARVPAIAWMSRSLAWSDDVGKRVSW